MSLSQRHIMIILIVVIVVGGGFYAFKQLMPAVDTGATGPLYSTQAAERGDISVGVETSGSLDPSQGGGIIVPGTYGSGNYVIDEFLVQDGDEVSKGQVVVRLKAPDLKAQIENMEEKLNSDKEYLSELTDTPVNQLHRLNPAQGITLRAPIDGRVVGLDAVEGDDLSQGRIVARVVDDSVFKVRAKLMPNEFKLLEKNEPDKMMLSFTQFGDFIEAKITHINPNPILEVKQEENNQVRTNYVYWITLEAENPGLAYPGMSLYVGMPQKDNDMVVWFRNLSTIDGYLKEERIISRAEGLVTEVSVHEMEMVEAGDPIISLAGSDVQKDIQQRLDKIQETEIELRQLYSKLNELEVKSPMDGIVASLYRSEGESVGAGEHIGHIYNTDNMRMWVQVDDVDVLFVKQGSPVRITVDAVPGETFEGEVTHVSTMGEDVRGIPRFYVTIDVKGGAQLRPGMQAQAFIDAGAAEDVLLIPVEAIFEEEGKSMVEILTPDGNIEVVPLTLGLMNDRHAEVKSGLEEGDLVVTGSTADLLPSQKIQSPGGGLLPDKDENGESENKAPENNQN